jgi:uncharacterized membrane protein YfcA
MVELLIYGLTYLGLGAVAGLMAGILGLGGGMVVVPGLYIFAHNHLIPNSLSMHFATGTSLATMIFTANAAVRVHYSNGHILWPIFMRLGIGLGVGAFVGVIVAQFLSTALLQNVFGVFLLLVAYKLYSEIGLESKPKALNPLIDRLVSLFIGFFSGLLGIGGGTMIIPYLTHTGVSIRQAAPISALCTMTVAIVGTLVIMIIGSFTSGLPKYAIGYVYWPAVIGIVIPSYFFTPLGVKLTYVLPIKHLKYIFIILVLLVAITMFV